MRAIAGPGHSSNRFVDYDPVTNPNGTVVTADWANDVQDDLIAIQDDQGVSEAAGSSAPVLEAIGKKILREQHSLLQKTDNTQPIFEKSGGFGLDTSQDFYVKTGIGVILVESGTAVDMSVGATVGQDYAVWAETDGTLVASTDFTSPPSTGAVKIGGFHYAPNGNATLDPDGNWANHTGGPDPAVPQINEYSIWDLKWRPSVDDPRGLALVPGLNEWWGIYPMNNGNVAGKPIHSYGVDPCRDGNAPYRRWADDPTRYNDATPMNIFELLASEGFRPPQPWNFQFAALGTTEEASAGGSDPGNTGEQDTAQDKNRFVSAWGLFDITGVIRAWSSDSWLDTTDTTGVTQGRSDEIFRIQRFANLGGFWFLGSVSGSRYVTSSTSSFSGTVVGGRGVCDHLVLV